MEERPFLDTRGLGGHFTIARALLNADSGQFRSQLSQLHPFQLAANSAIWLDYRRRCFLQHPYAMEELIQEMSHLDRDTVVRTLLSVQFNAFSTGMYVAEAMVNHSGAPNCVKFGNRIFATRPVQKGEEITITYLGFAERSFQARKRMMAEQHYCVDFEPEVLPSSALVDARYLSPSALSAIGRMEAVLDDNSAQITLEQLVGMLSELEPELVPCEHLVLIRCHLLIVSRVCEQLSSSSSSHSSVPGSASDVDVALTALRSCLLLKRVQPLYLGANHAALADTLEDMELILGFLISNDCQALQEAFPNEFPTFASATKMEYAAKKAKLRIRALYDC